MESFQCPDCFALVDQPVTPLYVISARCEDCELEYVLGEAA